MIVQVGPGLVPSTPKGGEPITFDPAYAIEDLVTILANGPAVIDPGGKD